jgi:AcrR family transcriptional regulator
VIEAATQCVAELGFRGATMTAIAERAGVTWGAIQHQFGDKDAILDAVLEQALSNFEEKISDVGNAPADPVQRAQRFTVRAGELLRGRSYQAFVEIQLNRSRAGDDRAERAEWGATVATALNRSWKAAFGDLGLSRRVLDESRRFVFMTLGGMAAESMLFPGADFSRQHLATLHDTLLRMLGVEAV